MSCRLALGWIRVPAVGEHSVTNTSLTMLRRGPDGVIAGKKSLISGSLISTDQELRAVCLCEILDK
jgi:hypothetical protein